MFVVCLVAISFSIQSDNDHWNPSQGYNNNKKLQEKMELSLLYHMMYHDHLAKLLD